MKVLLDTHVLLWVLTDEDRLSAEARRVCLDTKNKPMVSAASFWELAIKSSIGKIRLKENWCLAFKAELEENAIDWLSITPEHCHRVEHLPFIHRDPFDRMIVAQAMAEKMALVTFDSHLEKYGIDCIW